MNTESITDDIGAAHVALMLSRESVARNILARFDAETEPHYQQPALTAIFEAARAVKDSDQEPGHDIILATLELWVSDDHDPDGHAAAALQLIDDLPAEEGKALDEDAATARAAHYEQQMEARAKPRAMFPLITLADLESRPAPDWLIDQVLVCGKTSLLTAKHASFKSFFSLDMGLCVATGTSWHGRSVKQGAVVYVAAEGASGLVKRVRAWCQENGTAMPDNFHIIEKPAQVHTPALRRAFETAVAAVNPQLIVLDTLARCAVGLDENSAKDMGEFADALGLLADETGAHVLTVHHNNKGGEYRGSSAVPAAVDTHLSMDRDSRGEAVTLKCEKQKDAEEFETIDFIKAVVDWNQGKESSLVFRRQDNLPGAYGTLSGAEAKVLRELHEAFGDDGASYSKWWTICEDAGGISKRSFARALNRLTSGDYVRCPDTKKRGAIYTPNLERCKKYLAD